MPNWKPRKFRKFLQGQIKSSFLRFSLFKIRLFVKSWQLNSNDAKSRSSNTVTNIPFIYRTKYFSSKCNCSHNKNIIHLIQIFIANRVFRLLYFKQVSFTTRCSHSTPENRKCDCIIQIQCNNAYLSFGFNSWYVLSISVTVPVYNVNVKYLSTSSEIMFLYSMK